MARSLRDRCPSRVHLITIRTIDARIWMVPSPALNAILGGILARYQELQKIEIFAYIIMGNHIHLLVRAPGCNLDEFGQDVAREFAKRVNRHVGRKGSLWARRYDDLIVVEETDAWTGLIYIVTNPVKHGLVHEPQLWPGLSCYDQLLTGEDKEYFFTHYSKKDDNGDPIQTKHTLRLTPLPGSTDVAPDKYRQELREDIEERTVQIQNERKANGEGFLGVKAILRQKPGSLPKEVARSQKPPCYTGSAKARAEFLAEERSRRQAYAEASYYYRLGSYDTEFPANCYKPPLHRRPRIALYSDLQ